MTFGSQVIDFHRQLRPNWKIPKGIEILYPFSDQEAVRVFELFFHRFFSDENPRTFLFGINPGRFGAGITGIPFTDPKILNEIIGIKSSFKPRNELSSIFIYEMIDALGGPEEFYRSYYITSVCPLGFVKDGKNINYYDDKELQTAVEPIIIQNIKAQLEFGAQTNIVFSVGRGKNFNYLKKLNDEQKFFERIVALPHPRWVMQYRLKTKRQYIDEYAEQLSVSLTQ